MKTLNTKVLLHRENGIPYAEINGQEIGGVKDYAIIDRKDKTQIMLLLECDGGAIRESEVNLVTQTI